MRRPTAFALLFLTVIALAVALDSAALGLVAALMLLGLVLEATGGGKADMFDPMREAQRRRRA